MQQSFILCVKRKEKTKMSFHLTPWPFFEAHFRRVMGVTKFWIQPEKFHFPLRGHCFYLFFTGFSFVHFHVISFFQSSEQLYTVKVLLSKEKFLLLANILQPEHLCNSRLKTFFFRIKLYYDLQKLRFGSQFQHRTKLRR